MADATRPLPQTGRSSTRAGRQMVRSFLSGQTETLWTLRNASGASIAVLEKGAAIVSMHMPDRNGLFANVVLSYPDLADYQRDELYLGAVVGPYANRIANATFELDGQRYDLAANNGPHTLHSGPLGFHSRRWTPRFVEVDEGEALCFSIKSPHLYEGFPGDLEVTVTYCLSEDNRLDVLYTAQSSCDTVVSLSQHSYFNLGGGGKIYDHELKVGSGTVLEVDEGKIPTGQLIDVTGTVFDLRKGRRLGELLDPLAAPLQSVGGLDHNYVVDRSDRAVAELYHPDSGRFVTVRTNQPGLQVYTGNDLQPRGQAEAGDARHDGLALEAQQWPDAPNQPNFPSTLLRAGEHRSSLTSYQFGIR